MRRTSGDFRSTAALTLALGEAVTCADGLPDFQQVFQAIERNRVHTKSNGAVEARILAIGLQCVRHHRADQCSSGVNVRNRAARAGFDRFQIDPALLCCDVKQGDAVFVMRRQFFSRRW